MSNSHSDVDSYEKALETFGTAVKLLQDGNYTKAREQFAGIQGSVQDEPVLTERSKMYIAVCDRKLADSPEPGSSPDDLYYRAVLETNKGNTTEAIQLIDQAMQQTPNSAKLLFTRASAWALSGTADSAVNDLRQAIAIDPTIRFQAVNDPDFERIREEPGFIDIIEPTPAGA